MNTVTDLLEAVQKCGGCRIAVDVLWRIFAPAHLREWKLTGTPLKFRLMARREGWDFFHYGGEVYIFALPSKRLDFETASPA